MGVIWDWYQSASEEAGCSGLDNMQIFGGTVLEIWELDGPPFNTNDHVTDLEVWTGDAAYLSCNVDGCTPVATGWGGGSNGVTSTEFRLRLSSTCSFIDGKGCR